MSEELPATRTPVTAQELAVATIKAWGLLWNEVPRRETVLVLLAQSALETGRWKAMWNYNVGNVKSRPGDGRDWTFFRCNEVEHGKVVWYDPPHPACRFRAFRSLEAGAVDHLTFLRSNKRYVAAWPRALDGDPRGFVRELKKAGYFTAPLAPYENSVASIFQDFDKKLTFEVPLLTPSAPVEDVALDDDERERIMGLVALSLRDLSTEWHDAQHLSPVVPPKNGNA